MDLTEEKKTKVLKVLGVQYMSSEEDIDDDDGRYFIVHPLPWRCKKLNSTFKKFVARHKENQNKRSNNQTMRRKVGQPSERNPPPDAPSFAIASFDGSQ